MRLLPLILIFLIISFLLVGPYLIFAKIYNKVKRQQLEDRLNSINKQIKLQQNGAHSGRMQRKQRQQAISPGKMMLLVFIPLPPLLVIFVASSLYSAFISIVIYFVIIFSFYFLIQRIRRRRYTKAFIVALPNSIDLIIRSLRAGRTITDSIKTVGEETQGPVAEQFKNIVDQIELGKDFIKVVNEVSKKINIPEFSFFVIVLSVQQETGGNIIKTLSSLANMLRQRQLMRMKIKALSAEGIFSAFFMGSLPIAVAGIIQLIRPEYIALLLHTSGGQKVLIAAIISEIIGCLVIARMVQIDV